MTQEEIKTKFVTLITDHVGVFDLLTFDDLMNLRINDFADSLDRVEIVMELEEDFDISIPDVTEKGWKIVDDMYSSVSELVLAKPRVKTWPMPT